MSGKDGKGHHVCPWYMAYLFDNPLRSLVHRPEKILGPYVRPGMTVLDIGCGMGFFSLAMARMVGPRGRVISLDVQPEMLAIVGKRARRRLLADRIDPRPVREGILPVDEPADFALCFWMVHEIPDQASFFRELGRVLRPDAKVFIAEPGLKHVKREDFDRTLRIAASEGFSELERPRVRISEAVVLERNA